MTEEELNRFLQSVRRTRLVDYLEPRGMESPSDALDRQVRWAARVRHDPDHAAEASFLLLHQDALREHLRGAAVVEDEWIDFTGGDDGPGASGGPRLYQSSRSVESVDLSEPLSADDTRDVVDDPPSGPPDGPGPSRPAADDNPFRPVRVDTPSRQATAPGGQPRRSEAPPSGGRRTDSGPIHRERHQRPPPTPDSTPTPFSSPRGVDRRTGKSPSPLLQRVRQASPNPAVSRLAGKPRSPGRTPSPTPLHRGQTPPSGGGRAYSPPADRRRSPSPVPRGSTSPGLGARLSNPAPGAAPPPADTPSGYQVDIRGEERFLHSATDRGTSQVVYESTFDSGDGTPSSNLRSRGASGTDSDILGSLRSQAREGQSSGLGGVSRGTYYVMLALLIVVGLPMAGVGTWAAFKVATGGLGDPLNLRGSDVVSKQGSAYGSLQGNDTAAALLRDTDTDAAAPAADTDTTGTGEAGTDAAGTGEATGSEAEVTSGETPAEGQASTDDADSTSRPRPRPPRDTSPKATDTVGSAGTTAGDGGTGTETAEDTGSAEDAGTAEDTGTEPPVPAEVPAGPLAGRWRGNVGEAGSTADFSQEGEDIAGTIALEGSDYLVSGRHNKAKGTIYLKGANGVLFRGNVEGDRITGGTARLGAGQLPKTWSMIKMK